ncbi:Radical SAM superfamily protein [Methanococcoides vulcani]|uniref:Radical SAM superfamily protein n=1 Tax=Methanococcoides vulcani TaxID=1353158 RepID=A0A1I0ABY8_9EURY|nr:radical SAM protein [Methanococcoides vulcani]SES91192.1 Radical SAM superfamily protein [Methanococcoides vulcani]
MITTLFTYWSDNVWKCVSHYRNEFPKSKIIIGGIYATLHHKMDYFKKQLTQYEAEVFVGLNSEAEEAMPDYSLIDNVDYHVMHGMRGCIRKCSFCGTWKIEPKRLDKTPERISEEILAAGKNKVIFFDNNFLANKHIKEVLVALSEIRINGRPIIYESQSGFDGRLLENDPDIAILLKKARFTNVRIAWDGAISDKQTIAMQIKHLIDAGYNSKDIFVFMIYNYEIPIDEMIEKIKYCFKWEVQITDCRYRPLSIKNDNYDPHKWRSGQSSKDYFIHENWSDSDVRLFRKLVRIHNISVRYVLSKLKNPDKIWTEMKGINKPLELLDFYKDKIGYNKDMEKWSAIRSTYKFFGLGRPTSYDQIQSNEKMIEHIKLMNQVRTRCKKFDLTLSLKNLNIKQQRQKLLDMYDWCDIYSTYRFFDLDRPPEFSAIQSDKDILELIERMNKAKSFCVKNGFDISLKGLEMEDQKEYLSIFLLFSSFL